MFAKTYSFVADAKAFRLSRTAKNQKDFKVQAMDGWKRGKPYAMVVCPIYQLPARTSQIYQQASSRNVCIFTYSHLAVLIEYKKSTSAANIEGLLEEIFFVVSSLSPSKDASAYWLAINKTMLHHDRHITDLWRREKIAAVESIKIAKEEAITFLSSQREKIMRMTHNEALSELVRVHKFDSKIAVINSVSENNILDLR